MLLLVLLLTVADLQPLPNDQRVQLSPNGFSRSVQSCVETMDATPLFCGCVVRGFEMFLPQSDWDRVQNDVAPSHVDVITQVVTACQKASR